MGFPNYNILQEGFIRYLEATKRMKFTIVGTNPDDVRDCNVVTMPYIHRWTTTYRNRLIQKLNLLNDWYQRYPTPVTMVTLTTRQDMPIEQQIIFLKQSFTNLMKIIRKDKDQFDYFQVMEHHSSGYAHIHCAFFCSFTPSESKRYKKIWAEKYKAGSIQHGLQFSVRKQQRLASVTNYLMKYLTKSMSPHNMSEGQLLFNSIVWGMYRDEDLPCVRLYSCSRRISRIMDKFGIHPTEIKYRWHIINLAYRHPDGYSSHRELDAPNFHRIFLEEGLKHLYALSFD